MYGIIIEGIQHFVEDTYGADMWLNLLEAAGVNQKTFQTRMIYNEGIVHRVVRTASSTLGLSEADIFYANGAYFVSFMARYGYDTIFRVLGRTFPDFIRGLDNLHEYLRFSYPKIRPPSFVVGDETQDGLILIYTTRRPGYQHYVRGQLVTIAKLFFSIRLEVEVCDSHVDGSLTQYVLDLKFKQGNTHEVPIESLCSQPSLRYLPIPYEDFLSIFKFNMVLNENLMIVHAGLGFKHLFSKIENQPFDEQFIISRPFIEPSIELISMHTHNVFELIMLNNSRFENSSLADEEDRRKSIGFNRGTSVAAGSVKFKGEMIYVKEWKSVLFIGTPVIRDVQQMQELGLFMNDLNLHDSSREMVLAGSQQSDELIALFEKQMEESKSFEESLKKIAKERKRTDELLFQCIPKMVAKRLRRGESSISTCRAFEAATICFTKVYQFTEICREVEVQDVIDLLNSMYSVFDKLTEQHKVYKVETINDSYMLVSGVPNKTKLHAGHIAEMALDMVDNCKLLPNPANPAQSIKLYVGCHSGAIVAGVVGIKMPRYCLFGDPVNTSSRMMSHGEGKGDMNTYFLEGRIGGTEYNRYKEILEEDRLRSDDTSPTDSVASSRLSSAMAFNEEENDDGEDDMPSGKAMSKSMFDRSNMKKERRTGISDAPGQDMPPATINNGAGMQLDDENTRILSQVASKLKDHANAEESNTAAPNRSNGKRRNLNFEFSTEETEETDDSASGQKTPTAMVFGNRATTPRKMKAVLKENQEKSSENGSNSSSRVSTPTLNPRSKVYKEVETALSSALLEVVLARPADPIEHLATSLKQPKKK